MTPARQVWRVFLCSISKLSLPPLSPLPSLLPPSHRLPSRLCSADAARATRGAVPPASCREGGSRSARPMIRSSRGSMDSTRRGIPMPRPATTPASCRPACRNAAQAVVAVRPVTMARLAAGLELLADLVCGESRRSFSTRPYCPAFRAAAGEFAAARPQRSGERCQRREQNVTIRKLFRSAAFCSPWASVRVLRALAPLRGRSPPTVEPIHSAMGYPVAADANRRACAKVPSSCAFPSAGTDCRDHPATFVSTFPPRCGPALTRARAMVVPPTSRLSLG